MAINPNLWGITDPGTYAAVDDQGKPIIASLQQHGWSTSGVEGNPEGMAQWEGLKKIGAGSQELFNSLQELKSAGARGVAPAADLVTPQALELAGSFGIDQPIGYGGQSGAGTADRSGGLIRPPIQDRELTGGLTTEQGPSLAFREGLTEDQKKGITGLLTSRQGRWSETDKKNWNYATNNAVPTGATLISGPSGLSGLTEEQIWRQPGTNKVYRLPGGAPLPDGRMPGESIVDYTNRIGNGTTDVSSGATATSEQIRNKLKEEIRNELLPDGKLPEAPSSAEERIRLRRENGIINDEQDLNDIRNEARLTQEEMRVFKSRAGQGTSELGRIGAVSETERNMMFRMEGLALREQALVDRINSKNAYINQSIQDQQVDYGNALNRWNTEFALNVKVNELFNAQLEQDKQDALATVATIGNLMKEAGVPYGEWPVEMQQQVEKASMIAGLPKDLFRVAYSSLAENEKVLTTHLQDNPEGGKDMYVVTQNSKGEINMMKVGGIDPSAVAQATDTEEFYRQMSLQMQMAGLGIQMYTATGDPKYLGGGGFGGGGGGAGGGIPSIYDEPGAPTTFGAEEQLGALKNFRTVRHNNPIAVSDASSEFTNVLKKNGIAFSIGDPFGEKGQYHTIRFADPDAGWEGSRALLAESPMAMSWYKNHTGKKAMAEFGVKSNKDFAKLATADQDKIILGIFQSENGQPGMSYGRAETSAVGMGTEKPPSNQVASLDIAAGRRNVSDVPKRIEQGIKEADTGYEYSQFLPKDQEKFDKAVEAQQKRIDAYQTTKEEAAKTIKSQFKGIKQSEIDRRLDASDPVKNPEVQARLIELDNAEKAVKDFEKQYKKVWQKSGGLTGSFGGTISDILTKGIGTTVPGYGDIRLPPMFAFMFKDIKQLNDNISGLASLLGQTISQEVSRGAASAKSPSYWRGLEEGNIPTLKDEKSAAEEKFKQLYERIRSKKNDIKKNPAAFITKRSVIQSE